MQDNSGNNPTNYPARHSGGKDDEKDKIPPDSEHLLNILEIVGGLIFGVLGVELDAAGFHIWGYFFDSLALACGIFVLVHWIKKCGFIHHKKLLAGLLFADGVLFMFLSMHTLSVEKPTPQPTPRPAPSPVQTEPFIEGTEYTQKQLETVFPFGYAVFWFGQNKILEYKVFKNGLMDWKVDVDQVVIEPNFSTGMVTWTIPNVDAVSTFNGPGVHMTTKNGSFIITGTLKKGFMQRIGFNIGNQPIMYVATLNEVLPICPTSGSLFYTYVFRSFHHPI
jgi:hypothetical protein